jgi:hypothetical protein
MPSIRAAMLMKMSSGSLAIPATPCAGSNIGLDTDRVKMVSGPFSADPYSKD